MKKQPYLPLGALTHIRWLDSHRGDGWTAEKPNPSPLVCDSIGWIAAVGKGGITIAPHITQEQNPQRCGEMTIPKRAIIFINKL